MCSGGSPKLFGIEGKRQENIDRMGKNPSIRQISFLFLVMLLTSIRFFLNEGGLANTQKRKEKYPGINNHQNILEFNHLKLSSSYLCFLLTVNEIICSLSMISTYLIPCSIT